MPATSYPNINLDSVIIDQVHRITAIIEQALEKKQVCATMFLYVAQAFDKVWHDRLLHKIEQLLPRNVASC
jgi:hypothetical protein